MKPRKMKRVATTIFALIMGAMQSAWAQTLDDMARRAAQKYKVDISLVCAIINQESRWKQNAVSHAGAIGLMQIMPGTGRKACGLNTVELYDPSQNVNCGVYYFSEQLKRFGSEKLALCAYNAGPHRVKEYDGCPPFKETRNYHRKILAAWKSGKSCPRGRKAGKPPKSFKQNNAYLSAKGIADYQFIEGDFEPLGWWRLVCESLDVVYDREIVKTEPDSVGEPATTPVQIKTWLTIFGATVDDIYGDELRLRGSAAMLRSRIRENIINACPLKAPDLPKENNASPSLSAKKENNASLSLSAKGIADYRFLEGQFKLREWWRLVCESLDVVYDREIAKTEPESVSQPATSPDQIKTWLNIFGATVDDIYGDEQRLKGSAAMLRSQISDKIINACPQGRSN
ncbi:MAG: lytic transglycosylase domain-containing protein [Pseudomonadota bacterium]